MQPQVGQIKNIFVVFTHRHSGSKAAGSRIQALNPSLGQGSLKFNSLQNQELWLLQSDFSCVKLCSGDSRGTWDNQEWAPGPSRLLLDQQYHQKQEYSYPSKPCFELESLLDSVDAVKNNQARASLVTQWLRTHLPMQGTRVQALVWEDPTCCGATKPVRHNYWAPVPQLLKPALLEPVLCNKRSHDNEKPAHHNEE